jgi:N-acetylglucosaminyldiphosphoundecaprenol N-acetyl-beta-D-mannosaminyltransferase
MTDRGVASELVTEADLFDERLGLTLDDYAVGVATIQCPSPSIAPIDQAASCSSQRLSVLGVLVNNLTESQAVALMEDLINDSSLTRAIYFVNAHTLNTATGDRQYRTLLNRAFCVFGDGTGVRWAARCHGVRMQANLNGTDLVPRFFHDTAGRGYRYFLLGSSTETIGKAADTACRRFPEWELAGVHHGFVFGDEAKSLAAIDMINRARPHLLLVGMGNPRQEQWIDRYLPHIHVPLIMGTGGLFDHWAGNLKRASYWVRRIGCEWVQLLLQQPHKCRRYLLGNPLFLARIATHWHSDRRITQAARQALAERAPAR